MMRPAETTTSIDANLLGDFSAAEWHRLIHGDHAEPHRLLGAHPMNGKNSAGVIVRTFHPDAESVELIPNDGAATTMTATGIDGVFSIILPQAKTPLAYRLRFRFRDGKTWERDDPYRFLPTIGDMDLYLFNEGTHRRLWEMLGARPMNVGGVEGVSFGVWAPHARRVSVLGDFCRWDGRLFPMRQLGSSGVFEIFIPDARPGALYKFEIKTEHGELRVKSDPLARSMELPPGSASRVVNSDYSWSDHTWQRSRQSADITREPVNVYEVHLASWRRVPEEGNRWMTYREIAEPLAKYVKQLGFTHVELMPVAEHPFGGSWGYQVTGYYAPTSRFGTPDDFRYFVDVCHQHGIGVILDWVPAHFPRDDFALRRFDGTALYEHEDPRRGEHPDWGTLVFNYGRHEVRSFLISNALYWLKEFHIDGLRVDAVASMLYLDYSRRDGEWLPNPWGGKENVEAIDLLRSVNDAVHVECPGCFTVAEESTGWTGVTQPTAQGGLGFTFKWNMGWMHDTLAYFSKESVHRKYHQNELTFAMLYEHSERFINPLSHDEVVHGKKSLLEKMPGDIWQKFANLRLLFAYQYTRPGKKLLFMGSELAPYGEWYYDTSLDWHLAGDQYRKGLQHFLEELGRVYGASSCLWRCDPDHDSFFWIDCLDNEQSVLSYARQDGDSRLVVVLNMTPVPRDGYRIGAPWQGNYRQVFSSDESRFGGSNYATATSIKSESIPLHNQQQSIVLNLPPLGALVLTPT